ncbi:MAG TPA: hypothetical protein V6C88_00480 [Chroococcidiopsis sp.]
MGDCEGRSLVLGGISLEGLCRETAVALGLIEQVYRATTSLGV